jgi:DNA-binding transcriptional LysR family regulator
MDTLFLETLIAVIDNGTLVDAARKLNVTPGAVAQRLRALESELGTRLVMRAGRAVRPTDAGVRLAVRARAVLRDIGDLRFIAANETLSGELRLGAISTALTGMMPAILERLTGAHPQMEVFLEPGTSEHLYRRVQKGELDAAVIVLPRFAVPKTLDWTGLRKEPLIVIAAQALVQNGADADAHALLMNHPFIRYDRNQWGGTIADRYLRHAGLAPAMRFELDALDAIAVMVDRGLGVSLVPDWAPPWPQGLTLKKIALPQPFQRREIGVVWNKGASHITLINAFLGQARTAFPDD